MDLHDMTIYDLAEQKGKCFAKRLAFVDNDRRVTYGEFLYFVDCLAQGLKKVGLEAGDRIAILAFNGLEYLAVFFAAAKLGAITVPINQRLSGSEIEYVLSDSNPALFLIDERFRDVAQGVFRENLSVKRVLWISKRNGVYQEVQSLLSKDPIEESIENGGNGACVLIYTTAVAGKPRGAIISHHNLMISCLQMNSRFFVNEESTYLHILPLFHIGGLQGSLMAFIGGGINVFMESFDAKLALQLIEREKVTYFFSFAPILAGILDSIDSAAHNITSLRYVMGLDQAETIMRFERITAAKFYNVYGQTEVSGLICSSQFDNRVGIAGLLNPLVKVRIGDDYGHEMPLGQTGEILVRGPNVFKGYWGLDSATRVVFRDKWYHTGDRGKMDEDGYLWYAGRKPERELIKPGGENVYPAEVEKVLLAHPDVVEACVIGVKDQEWGEAIKAVCVRKPESNLEAQDLIDFVASRIARYKKPKYIEFVEGLPRNKDGTLDRDKIRREYGTPE